CRDGVAQKVRKNIKLQTSLESLIEGFRGQVGIYVYHLKSGKEAAVNADCLFPTASLVKIPILVGVFDKVEKKELDYHQPLIYHDSIQYGGTGLMQFFKDSSKTNLRILTSLMISYSDNTASLWNQALAGGGPTINKVMENLGFEYTRVNSRTPGREK